MSSAERREAWYHRLVASPMGLAGTVLVGIVLVLVIFGPALAPYDPLQFHARNRLEGPSLQFWMGTDQFGRDVFSRILTGARSSVLFGIAVTALGTVAGMLIGLFSGYVGGRTDEIIMRLLDALIAIPNLLLILLIVTVLGSSTTNAILAVGIAFAPSIARIARSVTLSVRTRDFVAAARARGEGSAYIMLREILPSVIAAIIVEASLRVAVGILIGATLSFLGLGAQAPSSDWGLMIAEAREWMFRNAWLVVWPGLFIGFVAIGFNLLGDGLRDALNPRVQH